jgi:rare lipoprotein A
MRLWRLVLCAIVHYPVLAVSGESVTSKPNWIGHSETGKASYYAMRFQWKKTASGELYDKDKKTAAHKKLPFGTKISVVNTDNSKSVIVKINDRGPFVKGRLVDLSASAFSSIADLGAGVIDVRIEVVE